MRIRELFHQAQLEKRKLFIPYITCGDPTLDITEDLVKQLTTLGADVIELGVPFSDPVADGKTNQYSAMRALKHGVSLTDCCQLIKKLRQQYCRIPMVLFTYFNPIVRLGIERFAELARECGVDAVLVVDLPVEEAGEFAIILEQHEIGRIGLISPTTTSARIQQSNLVASEFLYYVSRTGVTGVQSELSTSLAHEIDWVKGQTTLPIAIGFGISTPEQAAEVAKLADGVIVGSALVAKLETDDIVAGQRHLLALASQLRAAI